jgi:hypothetical protein
VPQSQTSRPTRCFAIGHTNSERKVLSGRSGVQERETPPERVRVYEKVRSGIWSYNGVFHLIDAWTERDKHRIVYKFKLVAVEGDEDFAQPVHLDAERRRIIPTAVKLDVWKREGGKCRLCQATDELHFDHIVPFAKGGSSLTADNVQLLCVRHNLHKRDHIE